MGIRITLAEEEIGGMSPRPARRPRRPLAPSPPQQVLADWHGPARDALLLYVPEEPEIGMRFPYAGLTWEIVDYRDGWIASLIVETPRPVLS